MIMGMQTSARMRMMAGIAARRDGDLSYGMECSGMQDLLWIVWSCGGEMEVRAGEEGASKRSEVPPLEAHFTTGLES